VITANTIFPTALKFIGKILLKGKLNWSGSAIEHSLSAAPKTFLSVEHDLSHRCSKGRSKSESCNNAWHCIKASAELFQTFF